MRLGVIGPLRWLGAGQACLVRHAWLSNGLSLRESPWGGAEAPLRAEARATIVAL